MLNLKIKLENQKSYIGAGNYFSKSLIFSEINQKSLLVIENDKIIKIYKKIINYIGKNLIEIKSNSNLTDFLLNENNNLYIITIEDLLNLKINTKNIKYNSLKINSNEEYRLSKLINDLGDLGYKYNEYNKKGSYKKLGDLLEITSFDGKKQYKISFWGDNVEEIFVKEFLNEKEINSKKIENLYLGNNEIIKIDKINIKEINNLIIFDLLDFHKKYDFFTSQSENFCSFDYIGQRNNVENLGINELEVDNIDNFKNKLKSKKHLFFFTKNPKMIKNFLELNNLYNYTLTISKENLLKSFETKELLSICDDTISKVFIKKRIKRNLSKDIDLLLKIKSGDYIVHIDHGVGIFRGITSKTLNNIKKEYIEIEYKNNDKLFVPVKEVGRISKYIGKDNPVLTGLNTKDWERKIKKVNEDIEIIAKEIVENQARKIINKGFTFHRSLEKEKDFINSFSYIHTNGQLNSIEEILLDMNSEKNMDRLLVGDVGFGKTEVAFNAIYTAFLNKKQSCIITPLVILAYEHFEKAIDRFKDFPIKIELLTRFQSESKTKEILKRLKNGKIDLLIGTHKILGKEVSFNNLGLVILDEEHKFGVKDKEKIKNLKTKVDTLGMSATPIPRSLNFALSKIKDISIIEEAPIGRQNINSTVCKYSDFVISEGYNNEKKRGGQIFFIHNKVENIDIIKKDLSKIIPEKKIVITHGRLKGEELEKRILDFKNKKYDVLLSTTVIENGIDFPNVNTIFINNADNFGLSQIHQLRGRVGRSNKKGYCYMLYKKENINKVAAERLKTIVDYSYLGAGFEIAMKDLEIRGAGEILGLKQSGKDKNISINLYLKLLEKKINELNNTNNSINCNIELNIDSYINNEYFNSETDKINFYKEIEYIENLKDLESLIYDFKNINGDIKNNEKNFFNLIRLKLIAQNYKIINIKKVGINYQIDFDKNVEVEDIKKFLKLDNKIIFNVVNINRLRTLTKNFENDEIFIQYMLSFEK